MNIGETMYTLPERTRKYEFQKVSSIKNLDEVIDTMKEKNHMLIAINQTFSIVN